MTGRKVRASTGPSRPGQKTPFFASQERSPPCSAGSTLILLAAAAFGWYHI